MSFWERLKEWIRIISDEDLKPKTILKLQGKFILGDRVMKIKGSSWRGYVVGFYSTELTPEGYCVESEYEPGSVQLYPATALVEYLGAPE